MAKKSKATKKSLDELIIEKQFPACVKKWYCVKEHLPEDEHLVYPLYCAVDETYYLGRYNRAQGWLNVLGRPYEIITHWCDDPIFMPFNLSGDFNSQMAKEYNYRRRGY